MPSPEKPLCGIMAAASVSARAEGIFQARTRPLFQLPKTTASGRARQPPKSPASGAEGTLPRSPP